VLDETTLTLSLHVMDQARADCEAEGQIYVASAGELLLADMVRQHKRPGRSGGAGFYEYPQERGAKKFLWPQLKPLLEKEDSAWTIADLKDRLLYRQALETARCLQEGVLASVHEANVGSIFGIGFPAWTGGALQFIYGMGIDAFVQRCEALTDGFGEGFELNDAVKACLKQYQPFY
jgi:3-hydroxyacyl-CoA dehydrogenase/enoyl-CoA hydratase/3-hydroxybutyryl-CoA epimerase